MLTPDRVIVRKLKQYDPNLFVKWNNEKEFFELWMKRPWTRGGGAILITPVTKSIYNIKEKIEFTSLDERLLWWVYDADSHKHGGHKKHALESDRRWKEFQKNIDVKRREEFRDKAKDIWTGANAFYTTKTEKKNGKPKFQPKIEQTFIRPDSAMQTSKRLFNRSKKNALAYNYRKSR
jgi:hypothetical protein